MIDCHQQRSAGSRILQLSGLLMFTYSSSHQELALPFADKNLLPHSQRTSSVFIIMHVCDSSMKQCRYLDGLRALGEVLLDSLESFGAVSFLCLLFLLVFSILGLHLFGEIQLDITFPNFNSFFNAFITVFQVCAHGNPRSGCCVKFSVVSFFAVASGSASASCTFHRSASSMLVPFGFATLPDVEPLPSIDIKLRYYCVAQVVTLENWEEIMFRCGTNSDTVD